MAFVNAKTGSFTLKAYRGDAKTLLAFNLAKSDARDLAGFTIQCQPKGKKSYYIYNTLQFADPGKHAQDPAEPPNSSINAPIHKFRWVHVPGSFHQGINPAYGEYTYTAWPRYFDAAGSLRPVDQALSASVKIDVSPFRKGSLQLGFTRGFVQSQAFVHHFGIKTPIRPAGGELLFDTAQQCGTNAAGDQFTFDDQYFWLGYTARQRVLEMLDGVIAKKTLQLDMFAYDLNEPDVLKRLLQLAKQGRVRLILDNAALHHDKKMSKPEDRFEKLFTKAAKKGAGILRGKFGRYAHDKVLIVSDGQGPRDVLTGSTNFSVTGMYVNSNHVLVFNDRKVASRYSAVFDFAWDNKAARVKFQKSPLAAADFDFASNGVPDTSISFAPHEDATASSLLTAVTKRVAKEGTKGKQTGSVLFAVMQMDKGSGPLLPALTAIHSNQKVFSYGISDSPGGIRLYAPKNKTGVLVTGKPVKTILPPPFDQVPGVGLGHQIHHKFVVCGFNTADAVVYCGSSNLTTGGEAANGDNLLTIRDTDVATAFAIEAVALVDHFEFLDRYQGKGGKKPPTTKTHAAAQVKWFLSTGDGWTKPYFDSGDLRSVDRELFA